MASLVHKDSYLQKLAKKICTQETREPQKRKFGGRLGDEGTQPKKKKRKKKPGERVGAPPEKQMPPGFRRVPSANPTEPAIKKPESSTSPSAAVEGKENGIPGTPNASGSFSATDLLRQRLCEKIQEVSGQGSSKALLPSVLEKRQRRKYERQRKKRRRKELRMEEKTKEEEEGAEDVVPETPAPGIVFNKVVVQEGGMLSPAEKRRAKRKALKGNLTPLTGKNYKQLLTRVAARKQKLEALKEEDGEKAQELEARMRWTNVLYKAEGVRIRDDEDRLKAALRRKEKRQAQRRREWERRTEQVAGKMQQRQERRRKNLRKKRAAKTERRKAKARKKGRVLPGDLEKAGLQ